MFSYCYCWKGQHFIVRRGNIYYDCKGPFKRQVPHFSWKFNTHPLPRNTNYVEPYIFVMLLSRNL